MSLQEKIRRRRASIKCDVIHNLLLVVHNMNAIVQIILLVNNEKKNRRRPRLIIHSFSLSLNKCITT